MQVAYCGLEQCGGGLLIPLEVTGLRWSGTLEEVGMEAANAGQQLRESGCSEWSSRRKGKLQGMVVKHTVTACFTNIVEMIHFLFI